MREVDRNPKGIRSVTVIVTHEDPAKDFSKTYGADQILEGARVTSHYSTEPTRRDWQMTTLEDTP